MFLEVKKAFLIQQQEIFFRKALQKIGLEKSKFGLHIHISDLEVPVLLQLLIRVFMKDLKNWSLEIGKWKLRILLLKAG